MNLICDLYWKGLWMWNKSQRNGEVVFFPEKEYKSWRNSVRTTSIIYLHAHCEIPLLTDLAVTHSMMREQSILLKESRTTKAWLKFGWYDLCDVLQHSIVLQSLRLEGVAVSNPMKAELLQLNQLRAGLLVTFEQHAKVWKEERRKEGKLWIYSPKLTIVCPPSNKNIGLYCFYVEITAHFCFFISCLYNTIAHVWVENQTIISTVHHVV